MTNKPDYIYGGKCSHTTCKNKFGKPPKHGIRIGDEYICQFHFRLLINTWTHPSKDLEELIKLSQDTLEAQEMTGGVNYNDTRSLHNYKVSTTSIG